MAEILSNSNDKQNNDNINEKLLNFHLMSSDEDSSESNFPYVIFTLHTNMFALNCKYIQSIEPVPPKTTEVSQSSPEIRGVSYYKEQAINLIDLRKLLGIISYEDYMNQVVNIPKRIQEHKNFVAELEDCIMNDKEIKVNQDPHQCNLGKWMDSYVPNSSIGKTQLDNITASHELLHRSVGKIINDISVGKKDEALKVFEDIKNKYSVNVIEKLQDLENILKIERKELTLIIRVGNKTVGLVVDSTENVESIDNIQPLPDVVIVSKYFKKYGLRNKDDFLLPILEASAFA